MMRRDATAGTAAADEIARFDALAQRWWDPNGAFRPLHQLGPVRLGFITDALAGHFGRDPALLQPFEGLRCLDIGCGGGLIAEPMARLGAAVTGVDASAPAIEAARRHAGNAGLAIDYRWALPEELAGWETRFDIVLALEVIEHVKDLDAFFAAVVRLLEPDGALIVATLNRTITSLALAKIGAEYLLRWLPAGTHDWWKFVRPAELARVMRRHDLRLVRLAGMHYSVTGGTWRLGGDLDVNYIGYGRPG
jgi:2-polyprenyl-6-hydroxyphenyl methylase/3-demethylubiquinone-9 3-methyltransferase